VVAEARVGPSSVTAAPPTPADDEPLTCPVIVAGRCAAWATSVPPADDALTGPAMLTSAKRTAAAARDTGPAEK
jgi:hypothetical protein